MAVMYAILIAAIVLIPLFYNKNNSYRTMGLACFCILLFFFAAFRGDFTADYVNYCRIYESFIGKKIDIFFDPRYDDIYYVEKGYGLLNFLLARLFHNPQTIIIAASLIIICVYYKFGKKVNDKFLYVLLLINIGSYFQSFNITRQIMAACICMCAYSYVQEKKFIRYCLVVLLASTFHISSIIMLPFYWLLRWKINLRNALLQILATVVTFSSFDLILAFMDKNLFAEKYEEYEVFGEFGVQTVLVPLAICLFVIAVLAINTVATKKELENSDGTLTIVKEKIQENAILYNGTIYWMLTYFMALKFYYMYRFSSFFCLYAILAVVKSTDAIKDGRTRVLVKFGIAFMMVIYYVFFGQYFGNYEFCFH